MQRTEATPQLIHIIDPLIDINELLLRQLILGRCCSRICHISHHNTKSQHHEGVQH